MAETLLADEDLTAAPAQAAYARPVTGNAPVVPTELRAIVNYLQRTLTELTWLRNTPPTPDMWHSSAAEALADARIAARTLVASLESMA